MDNLDEVYQKSKLDNSFFNNPDALSLLSSKILSGYDNELDDLEDKIMKKIYSSDRIASTTKIEVQNQSAEKLSKHSKLFRSSSTFLDKKHNLNDLKETSKLSFGKNSNFQSRGNDLFSLDVLEMKKYALGIYIQENPKAADLKWSLFCAACHSYRYDSVLRPFPHMFLDGDVKDIDKLRNVAESCPSIKVLFEQIKDRNSTLISVDLINLLYWVLIHVREPQLKFVPKDKHDMILSNFISASTAAAPDYIFQVVYNKNSEKKFMGLAKNYKIIQVFHDSRLDNFYSILNYGLQISFNKLSPYGPGIQLTSEMNVSLPYSQTGFSWGGSYFGSQISVVALCEMIDHPDVKYSNASKTRKNKFMTDIEPLPEKCFVVQNSDLIRVKYLLIYCNSFPEHNSNQLSTVVTWFRKNKVIAVVLAYIFLLTALATSNNSALYKFYRRMTRKMTLRVLKLS